MVTLLFAVGCGTGIAVGLLGLRRSLRGSGNPTTPQCADPERAGVAGSGRIESLDLVRHLRQLALPLIAGCAVAAVSGWPVAGGLGALAVVAFPSHLRKGAPGATSRRAEAIASWTELIRDALAASAGMAQAVIVTASAAPAAIRPQVATLAGRLSNGVPMSDALRQFAIEADDPAAEFLVCALILATTSRAQKLVEVLGALAESMREDVAMRLRVDSGRASARSGVRTILIFTGAFSCGLAIVAHAYLAPFGTPVGQLVLAMVGLCFAAGLGLMARLVRPRPMPHILDVGRA